MKFKVYFFIKMWMIFFIVTTMFGCTVIRSVTESVSGNYMGGLEQSRANSNSKIFDYKIDECFTKVLDILKSGRIEAQILKVDIYNYSILALVSRGKMMEDVETIFDANSADVAIFFSEEGKDKTKVEITSLSLIFAEFTARKIFSELQKRS